MTKARTAPGGAIRAKPVKTRKKSTTITPAQREAGGEGAINKHWRTYFLAALVETSNVSTSAKSAGISTSRAYKVKLEDTTFAAQWRAALLQGYEHLEMEVLGYLRGGIPDRKMDVTAAIKLLALHRQEVARERAVTDERSEQEVLDSIDAMIDEMRERSAANEALLAQDIGEEANDGE
jgi:hypothetical protein